MGTPKLVWRSRQGFCKKVVTERASEERVGTKYMKTRWRGSVYQVRNLAFAKF